MSDVKQKAGAHTVVINTDAALADGDRVAADYDNSTALALVANFELVVEYDTTAPAAGKLVAELWIIPGDGESTEHFAEGGDGTTGTDFDPQQEFFIRGFVAVNPSNSAPESLGLKNVELPSPHTNRIVLKNVSGQQFDSTWELRMTTKFEQIV